MSKRIKNSHLDSFYHSKERELIQDKANDDGLRIKKLIHDYLAHIKESDPSTWETLYENYTTHISSSQTIYLSGISGFINKISKCDKSKKARILVSELATIGVGLNSLKSVSPKHISLMLNGMSKYTSQPTDTIKKYLNKFIQLKKKTNTQDIVNVLNCLAKLDIKGCESSIKTLFIQFMEIKEDAGTQAIANVLNCLAKLDIKGCESDIQTLLTQFMKVKDSANTQHIANVLNCLAKLDIKGCESDIKRLLTRFIEIKEDANPQHIANVLNCLAKLYIKGCESDIKILLNRFMEIQHDANKQEIANVLNCLTKLDIKGCELSIKILLTRFMEIKQDVNTQDIANVLNCLAKLDIKGCESDIQTLLARFMEIQHDANPQEIANVLNCLAKLDIKSCESDIKTLLTRFMEIKQDVNTQDIANVLNCLVTHNINDEANIKTLLTRFMEIKQDATTQAIANVLNCLAKHNIKDEANVKTLLTQFMEIKNIANPQHIANVLNCLAKLDIKGCESDIKTLLTRFLEITEDANTQDIATVLNCLAKHNIKDEANIKTLFTRFMEIKQCATTQAIANVLNCLAKLDIKGCESDIKMLLARFMEIQHDVNTQEIATVIDFFHKMNMNVDTKELKDSLLTRINAASLNSFSPDPDIAMPSPSSDEHYTNQLVHGILSLLKTSSQESNFTEIENKENDESHEEAHSLFAKFMTVLTTANNKEIALVMNDMAKINLSHQEKNQLLECLQVLLKRASSDVFAINFLPLALNGIAKVVDYSFLEKNGARQFLQEAHELSSKINNISCLNAYYLFASAARLLKISSDDHESHLIFKSHALSMLEKLIHNEYVPHVLTFSNTIINLCTTNKQLFTSHNEFIKYLTATFRLLNKGLDDLFSDKVRYDHPTAKTLHLCANALKAFWLFRAKYKKQNFTLSQKDETPVIKINDVEKKLAAFFKQYIDSAEEPSLARFNVNALIMTCLFENDEDFDEESIKNFEEKYQDFIKKLVPCTNNDPWDKQTYLQNLYEQDKFTQEPRRPDEREMPTQAIPLYDHHGKRIKPLAGQTDSSTDVIKENVLSLFLPPMEAKKPPYLLKELSKGRHLPRSLFSVIKHEEESYVSGIMYGSAIKDKKNLHDQKQMAGKIPAFRIKDIFHGDLGKKIQVGTPNREAAFYSQRQYLPSVTRDEVLVGKFKIAYCADDQAKLKTKLEKYGLMTQDGCGYIKESLFNRLKGEKVLKPHGQEPPHITYQALQHIHRPEGKKLSSVYDQAIQEITKQGMSLRADQSTRRMYAALTTGNPPALNRIAVPAYGDKPILCDEVKGAIVIGRSPYDKPNLIPCAPKQYKSPTATDRNNPQPSQAFHLAQLEGIQYSLTGIYKDVSGQYHDHFAKGIYVVVPDEDWPKEYETCDILASSEDPKIDSDWETKKNKLHNVEMELHGALAATEWYGAGSFVAIPPKLQKYLNGDYDGDPMLIQLYSEYSALFKLIEYFYHQDIETGYANPKLPKSTTSAYTPTNEYIFTKFLNILAAKSGLLLERFTYAYNIFCVLKPEYQEKLASAISDELINQVLSAEEIADIKNGLEPSLKNSKMALKIKLMMACLSKGIKLGTDSYKTYVNPAPYKIFLNTFQAEARALGIPDTVVYFKGLNKILESGKINFDLLEKEIAIAQSYFSSIVLDVLANTVKKLKTNPDHFITQYLNVTEEEAQKRAQKHTDIQQSARTGKGVLIIVKDKEGQVLVGKQKNKNSEGEVYALPGGKIDYIYKQDEWGKHYRVEEEPVIAAARELWEETGIRLDLGEYNPFIKKPSDLATFLRSPAALGITEEPQQAKEKLLQILKNQLKEIKSIDTLKFDKNNRNAIFEYQSLNKLNECLSLVEEDETHDVLEDLQWVNLNWVKENIDHLRMNKLIAYHLLNAKKVIADNKSKTIILLANGDIKEIGKMSPLPPQTEKNQTREPQPVRQSSLTHLSFFQQPPLQFIPEREAFSSKDACWGIM